MLVFLRFSSCLLLKAYPVYHLEPTRPSPGHPLGYETFPIKSPSPSPGLYMHGCIHVVYSLRRTSSYLSLSKNVGWPVFRASYIFGACRLTAEVICCLQVRECCSLADERVGSALGLANPKPAFVLIFPVL